MTLIPVRMNLPAESNIIVGQSHFIKTVEDLYETLVCSGPSIKFGVAFCEASGDRLVRWDGNDRELTEAVVENARNIAAGHVFVVLIRHAYPINVLNAIKACPEVCRIFCATANPLEVIVIEREQGRGVIGIIDGLMPLGVEDEAGQIARKELLGLIGYKR